MVKKELKTLIGKILYGTLFVIILPLFLVFWARHFDNLINFSVPEWKFIAITGILSGDFFIIKGIIDLWIFGKGLPMNTFPPKNFVTRGIYAWFSHPIYIGAGLLSAGLSLGFGSSGGLYLVTPVLILAMISLVYGYERFAILKIFGKAAENYKPVFSLSVPFIKSFLQTIWYRLKNVAEWVANSRHDWIFLGGKFRIINHSIYSGLAGAVGVGIIAYITENSLAALILAVCVILGAAFFAQFRWGSTSLLRPFGYWGGIIGGIIGIILTYALFRIPLYQLALAGVLCAPFIQAIGRFRCLAQGCCHGIITSKEIGIRVWQEQSRVVVLSGLKGQYIIPTQLCSILFNIFLGSILFAMWLNNFATPLIVGLYLILTGIERFTEDAYRGEKQTRIAMGLKENQWIAIGALIVGIIITILPISTPSHALGQFNLTFWIAVLFGGLIAAFSMSMDFPKSNIRFSRLSG